VAAAIDVYPAPRPNGEIWYRVKVNGRDLEAEWADPDAARGRGERYARELRGRGGTKMETTETEKPDEPDQTLPDEPDEAPDQSLPDEPDEAPDQSLPDEPGKSDEEHGRPEDPGKSEDAPGHNKDDDGEE